MGQGSRSSASASRWGTRGSEDTSFRFKSGFSPKRHLFQTVRIMIDRPAYDDLTARWEARYTGSAPEPTAFFPGYRGPEPTAVTPGAVIVDA